MPGLIASLTVGVAWNCYVAYRKRVHGEERQTTSSAIRQLRQNRLGEMAYVALHRHWSSV